MESNNETHKEIETPDYKRSKRQRDRSGLTKITSVSVSNEVQELVDRFNLSPTEVFRRGVAVTLSDMDVPPYNNQLNKLRLDKIKQYIKDYGLSNKLDQLNKLTSSLKEFEDMYTQEINLQFNILISNLNKFEQEYKQKVENQFKPLKEIIESLEITKLIEELNQITKEITEEQEESRMEYEHEK